MNNFYKNIIISLIILIIIDFLLYKYIDKEVAIYFYENSRNTLYNFFDSITDFVDATWFLIISLIMFIIFSFLQKNIYKKKALFFFSSIALSGIIVIILKFIFGRYRPVKLNEENLYGFEFFQTNYYMHSFPSGHAVTSFAIFTSLSILFPKYKIIFYFLGTLFAFSRIVVWAHFPSDSITGAYVGIIVSFCLAYYFKIKARKH